MSATATLSSAQIQIQEEAQAIRNTGVTPTKAQARIINLAHNNGWRGKNGINWSWVEFDTQAEAVNHEKWLTDNGYETRGVYPPDHAKHNYSVRWR